MPSQIIYPFSDHLSLALNLKDPSFPQCGSYHQTKKWESKDGHIKRNLPFLIHPPDRGDRGLPAETTQLQSRHTKQAMALSTWTEESSKLNDSPSLPRRESTVKTTWNPNSFFILQDYLFIANFFPSQTQIKPLLLTGRGSCASFLEVYLHLLSKQQRSTIRASNISKMSCR